MSWSGIAKRYPQIAMAGLPGDSPGMLENEVRRHIMELNKKPAHREVNAARLPVLIRHPKPSAEQV